jgi:WD40 repeat protein
VLGRGKPITALAFHPTNSTLASWDQSGFLRIWAGFYTNGLPGLVPPEEATFPAARQSIHPPTLSLETRTEADQMVRSMRFSDNTLSLNLANDQVRNFTLQPSQFPEELYLHPLLTQLAWHPTEPQLCVINDNDTFWLHTSPLHLLTDLSGKNSKNPIGVAWDPLLNAWALPKADEFSARQLIPDASGWHKNKIDGFKIEAPMKDQGKQTRMAAGENGRMAVYCGRRIQFARSGRVAPVASALLCKTTEGLIENIQWSGRLLAATFKLSEHRLILEYWTTDDNFPPKCEPHEPLTLPADSVLPTPDGSAFVVRDLINGLSFLDPNTGRSTPLDNSPEARQAEPMAVSHDGKLLAAIMDRNSIYLTHLPTKTHLATLTCPRNTALRKLSWNPDGSILAALTDDGHVQLWKLAPWLAWLKSHQLASP